MTEPLRVSSLASIPKGTGCQEPNEQSGLRFFPCNKPAVAIIDNPEKDEPVYNCFECASRNLRTLNARIVFTKDKRLPGLQSNTRPTRWIKKGEKNG